MDCSRKALNGKKKHISHDEMNEQKKKQQQLRNIKHQRSKTTCLMKK